MKPHDKAKIRAVVDDADRDQSALHHRGPERPRSADDEAHPRKFEALVATASQKPASPAAKALKDAGLNRPPPRSASVLVGACRACRRPGSLKQLSARSRTRASTDEVRAIGAALQAGVLPCDVQGRAAAHVTTPLVVWAIENAGGVFPPASHRPHHHDPDQEEPGVLDRPRTPERVHHPRLPGRA